MTKLKIGIVSAIVVAAVAIPVVLQQKAQTERNTANEALRQQVQRANQLAAENEALLKKVASLAQAVTNIATGPSPELLRLRNEVAQLRRENTSVIAGKTNTPSALSGLRANPDMWKMIRDQQKVGMSMIYSELGKRLKLTEEQTTQFNELLADHVMENIDQITTVLAEKKSPEEADALFSAQEAALNGKIKEMLGDEAFAQYQDYTKNLASYITAEQFKGMGMTGEKEEKEAKAKQLYQILQEETQQTLASAGLPADYQLVPTLNFRNFVSETTAEKNLKLLEVVYDRATLKAGTVLNETDLKKFGEFRNLAIKNNRMGLAMNRQLMAPGSK